MERITIHPVRLRQFGPGEGSTFCLVTNPELLDQVVVAEEGDYATHLTLTCGPGDSFDTLLAERIPEPAHVLVVSPACFFRSPAPELLGPRRKLLAMACNSTPTSLAAIHHFLGVIERTDPERQQRFAERFFYRAERAGCLEIRDDRYHTRLVFSHLAADYEWNQQAGPLDWGDQQIAPSGEISVLPVFIQEFAADLRLALEGEISLCGHAILHAGTPSFLREDQARIHAQLETLRHHALIASVARGEVTSLRATHRSAAPAARMLEALFAVDSRYRIVWEIGFAINFWLELLPGNFAMNEVYGGTHGALHWGFGLTPFTQYHLDVICPGTRVYAGGELLLGTPEPDRSEAA